MKQSRFEAFITAYFDDILKRGIWYFIAAAVLAAPLKWLGLSEDLRFIAFVYIFAFLPLARAAVLALVRRLVDQSVERRFRQ